MRIWKYIYLGWAVLCVVGGYSTLAPERTKGFIVGWPFIITTFFFFCIGPLVITALNTVNNRRRGIEMIFRRPSFRSPFSRRDPLQTFRLYSVSSTLITLGACFALKNADDRGVMMFWTSVAMSAGLLIGEGILYLVHWKKIY